MSCDHKLIFSDSFDSDEWCTVSLLSNNYAAVITLTEQHVNRLTFIHYSGTAAFIFFPRT
jgi:hypothetical protein